MLGWLFEINKSGVCESELWRMYVCERMGSHVLVGRASIGQWIKAFFFSLTFSNFNLYDIYKLWTM